LVQNRHVHEATYIKAQKNKEKAHSKRTQRIVSSVVVLLCFAFLVIGGFNVISATSNAYVLVVDGEEVATLVSWNEAEAAITQCMENQSLAFLDEYSYDVSYTNDLVIETIPAINVVYNDVAEAAVILGDKLHLQANATAVMINDQKAFCVANETAALEAVKNAKNYYADPTDPAVSSVYTTEKITLTGVTVECSSVLSLNQATNMLLFGQTEKPEDPKAADTLITVNVERYEVETIPLPYKTIRNENNTLARGTEEITSVGVDGLQEVTNKITEVNGVPHSNVFVSSVVIEEAVDEIIEVGTYITYASRGQNGSGEYGWPLAEGTGTISSRFGWRSMGWHSGVDIADPVGTVLYAAEAGTVIYADYISGGYGNLVTIDHGDGVETRYAHCDEFLVEEGDYVERGTAIGTIGMTGRTTGPHVHFEIRFDDNPVDPLLYLDYGE